MYQIVKCDAENFNPEALMTIQAESLQQSKREDRSISLVLDSFPPSQMLSITEFRQSIVDQDREDRY